MDPIHFYIDVNYPWSPNILVPQESGTRAPSQYPKRRLSVRSRKVSKPRDLYLELSDRSEIWQALRQQCCRCACQISKRYDNLKYQSRGFETLRDLRKRRLFGYWDGAQDFIRQRYIMAITVFFPCSHEFHHTCQYIDYNIIQHSLPYITEKNNIRIVCSVSFHLYTI